MFYSKLTGGFYTPEIHGDAIPADAVEITQADHASLLAAQCAGKTISTNLDGYPIAISPSPEELIAAARAAKTVKISSACRVAIESGITSSALGTPYTYPTAFVDQHNIIALVLGAQVVGLSYEAKFWCADASGVWVRRLHTAAQLIQLGQEMAVHTQAQQTHYELLLDQLAAAQTVEEIEAVTW